MTATARVISTSTGTEYQIPVRIIGEHAFAGATMYRWEPVEPLTGVLADDYGDAPSGSLTLPANYVTF